MTGFASTTYNDNAGARGRCGGRFARNPWSVWEIGAMVAGFVVFWPLGLLALFLKWKNGEMWRGASTASTPWSGFTWKRPEFSSWQRHGHGGFGATGNQAFDDYRRAELAKLDEMRRKLGEEQKAFHDFVDRLRRAKDQDEFDRFMAERRNAEGESPEPKAS